MGQRFPTISITVAAFLALLGAPAAHAEDFEKKCDKRFGGGMMTTYALSRCIESSAKRQAVPLKGRACGPKGCIYRLRFVGQGRFTGSGLDMHCRKGEYNGWPGNLCIINGLRDGAGTAFHICGSRDCMWNQTPRGVNIYGLNVSEISDAKAGETLIIKVAK